MASRVQARLAELGGLGTVTGDGIDGRRTVHEFSS
jgi:hypothetical protein